MASKKEITIEQVNADIAKWTAEGSKGFNKTKMTLDWMDTYVACNKPDEIEKWAKECAGIDPKEITDKNGNQFTRANVAEVVKLFLNTFFPDFTDEAIAKKKEEAKKKKQAEKEEAEALKQLSPEEQILAKLNKIKEKNNK